MRLRTPLCEKLGIEQPIILAGMGGIATPDLVAAVSNAGGLGVLGAASMTPDEIAEAVATIRRLTDKPFGVDTLLPSRVPVTGGRDQLLVEVPESHTRFAREFAARHQVDTTGIEPPPPWTEEFTHKQVETIIDLRVPVYAAGLGDPAFMVEAAHRRGITVLALVGNVKNARRVAAGGLDAVVAQGSDAGGHNSRIGTMALVPQVVDAVAPIPVVAAGAIADGRGLVAALALGAQAVWCGTVFLVADEAGTTQSQKQATLEAGEEDTIISKSISGKPARMLRNSWATEFEAALDPLPMPFQRLVAWPVWEAAARAGRRDVNPGFAGQIVGLVNRTRPAAAIVSDMIAQARTVLTDLEDEPVRTRP